MRQIRNKLGAPQESILRLLLFLINKLPESFKMSLQTDTKTENTNQISQNKSKYKN